MENGDTAAVHGATHSPAIRVRSTHTSFGRIERGSVITMASGASPFRPLSLSHGDAAYLKELVHVFVQHQVESYERYLHEDHEHIDNKRWKLTLQRDNMKVFSEQAGAKGSNPVDDPGFVNEQEPPDMADLPALLAVGHMEGSLDDAMQRNHSLVDVFARASVNSGGHISRAIATKYCATALISSRKQVHCARLKKLAWLLRTRDTGPNSTFIRGDPKCIGCGQRPGIFANGIGACTLCKRGLCTKCRLKIELGFVSRVGGLVPKKLWFCTYCLDEAARTSSRVVACGEHTDTRLYEPTPWSSGSTGVSSPSSSDRDDEWGSLDSKRYLNLLP
ncbi:hypothetical protein PRIC2_013894 [Phytophthora ramorum]